MPEPMFLDKLHIVWEWKTGDTMRPTDQETTAGEKTVYYSSFGEGHAVPWGGGGAAWGSTSGPGG